MKAIIAALAAGMASASGLTTAGAQEPAAQTAAQEDINTLFRSFVAARQESDSEALIAAGEAMLGHPNWSQVNPEYKAYIRFQLALHYWSGRGEEALEMLALAEPDYDPVTAVTFVRALLLTDLERWPDAAREMQRLASSDPERFSAIELRTIWRVANGLSDAGETDLERSFLETVVERHDAEDPFDTTDYFRLDLARHYARGGQARRALLTARGITISDALAPLHYEGVFSDLWRLDDFAQVADLAAASEREIASLEARLAEHPNNLNGAVMMVQALSAAGRHEEANAFAEETYARLRDDPMAFIDTAERENWFLNEWAYVRFALGDSEGGEARMREGATIAEGGRINVSQVINLSDSQNRRGGFQDALDTLADFDEANASDVGDMFAWGNQACAHYGLGNRETADAIVARMDAQWETNPPALQEALACKGDTDAGAALFLRRLDDERFRPAALNAVQVRQPLYPESIYGPHHQWREELRRVHERPEVRAAIETHGRIVELPLFETYWGDV